MHVSPRQTSKTGQVGHVVGVSTYVTPGQTKLEKPEGPTQAPKLPLQGGEGDTSDRRWGKPHRAGQATVQSRSPSLGTLEYLPHLEHFQTA